MTTTAPPRFSLRIPDSWFEFDVWRATHTGDLARMVDQRVREFPELRPHRGALVRNLRQLAEEAERGGALLCAAGIDDVSGGRLLITVTVFSTPGMPEPLLNTVDAIAAQIRTTPRTAETRTWREVRVVELAAGRAVRVQGVSEAGEGGQPVPIVSMQTLVPKPGADTVLNVVLTSPQVQLVDDLLEMFEAVSATLAWEEGPPVR